ncbi:hypothetical protein GGI15_004098 [Coemansia interrupta]|uniref:Extracellular metalloproteinase n=1 Tax=Coemansia interrupta TaxID=1126814 RepID=A0A9W8H4W4_9FUNG|nr:hypothetical protein GGI15_004098 [Coemansia interrupta]
MRITNLVFVLATAAVSTLAISSSTGASDGVKPFRPLLKSKPKFTVYKEPVALDGNLLKGKMEDPAAVGIAAAEFISQTSGTPSSNMRVTSAYTDASSGVTHVYLVQTVAGKDVANSVANVNVAKGKVISSSHSFAPIASVHKAEQAAASMQGEDKQEAAKRALAALAKHLGHSLGAADLAQASVSPVDSIHGSNGQYLLIEGITGDLALDGSAVAEQAYVQDAQGRVVPAWRVNVEQTDHWWNAHVAADGTVLKLTDWYARSESYRVYPANVNSPDDGARKLVADPANTKASPKGWVTEGATYGNNVWAQSNPTGGGTWKTNHRPAGNHGVFDYALDLGQQPKTYIDAAITQLFYTANILHDLSFVYGFDEASGNFQDVNYSGQGLAGDAVIANAQDGSGTNNANFATPPDGQRPRMRMYVWTQTSPQRDGDLEQDIVAHEYSHGISTRLTGGPADSDCLGSGEPGGMGEGWGDVISTILRLNATHTHATDFILGKYAYGKSIRRYPYSTSLRTNPSTLKFLDRPDYREVHDIGEVWAEILYEVLWALVDKNGLAEDLFDRDLTKGNALMLQLLLDGMKLQPCNPSFIDARDAIMQAERNLTGGKNQCAMWAAFAKRGMGPSASGSDGYTHTEDYWVPDEC